MAGTGYRETNVRMTDLDTAFDSSFGESDSDSWGESTPTSHLELDLPRETVEWLESTGDGSVEDNAVSTLKMAQLRDENLFRWNRLLNFAKKGSRERVRLLRLLVERRQGATYDDMVADLDVGKERVREFVSELKDAEVVEGRSRPKIWAFSDEKTRVLAADVASKL